MEPSQIKEDFERYRGKGLAAACEGLTPAQRDYVWHRLVGESHDEAVKSVGINRKTPEMWEVRDQMGRIDWILENRKDYEEEALEQRRVEIERGVEKLMQELVKKPLDDLSPSQLKAVVDLFKMKITKAPVEDGTAYDRQVREGKRVK